MNDFLKEFFHVGGYVKDFKLRKVGIEDCSMLAKCLYELESLENLDLSENFITPKGIVEISNSLMKSFWIWNVNLSFNKLDVSDIRTGEMSLSLC